MAELLRLVTSATGTTTGSSTEVKRVSKAITVACDFSNSGGSCTALTIALQGSIDGANFYELAEHAFTAGELTALKAMFHVANKPIKFVKGQIKTLTDTGTTTVNITAMEEELY